MIEEHCLGPDVDRSRISPDATISGASYLTGSRTAVAGVAVVHNARLHDAVIGARASVTDTILVAEGPPHSHCCDAAGRTVVRSPDQPAIGDGARVTGCTLINSAIGGGSHVTDTWAQDCRIGDHCRITDAKIVLAEIASRVTVAGPTEISEAWLGHHTTIDQRGYYEGIFSNSFHRLEFDETAGRLRVVETIDLPHVSRYGLNTINSTNSGKLLPQESQTLESLGTPAGLWGDRLLSHEQIELAPCCWVVPWTKVIGQSPTPHPTDDDLVNDEFTTYLMPFSMAGFGGELTRGLVMPGELSVGVGPKQRRGAWVFTYAPDAVIRMVARLHEALEPERESLADTIVIEAIRTAIEMTRAMAHRHGVDLSVPSDRQRRGWGRWIAATHQLLTAHLDADLWRFSDGRPVGWTKEGGRWTHPHIGGILALAPDALAQQKSVEDLFACHDPVPPVSVAVPSGAVAGTDGPPQIDPAADVAPDAVIGLGCRIGPGAVVESGAAIWNSVIDGSTVGLGARIERSILAASMVEANALVRSCRMDRSRLGRGSDAHCAHVVHSDLAERTTLSAFADVRDTRSTHAAILGGTFHGVEINTHLMSMHMAGGCSYLKALPTHVSVDGQVIAVPAVLMLGGGALVRGHSDHPVTMEACFIGSNAVIEPNTHVGPGCFVLGRLGPDAGLPPFTISLDGNPAHNRIGAVLSTMASMIITHALGWTYNAAGTDFAPGIAHLLQEAIGEGVAAIEWEMARRAGEPMRENERFGRYSNLSLYSPDQLAAGLDEYRWALSTGAWDMIFQDGELRFASVGGTWIERNGSAFWERD